MHQLHVWINASKEVKWSWSILRFYRRIFLEGMKETTKTPKHNLHPGHDSRLGRSDFQKGVLNR
jgi:hypothetical protein